MGRNLRSCLHLLKSQSVENKQEQQKLKMMTKELQEELLLTGKKKLF